MTFADLAWLPPGMSETAAFFLLGVSFVASLIAAAFSLGGGVVMIAVLASFLPPAALIPVHAVVQVGSNAGRAALMLRQVDWPVWGTFLIGTVVGVAIGGVIVVDLPAAIIQIAVGLFILWTIVGKPPAFLRHSAWLAGVISSILTMFFGATGPFIAAYLKTRNYDRITQTATHAACMTAQHGLKIVAFGVLGFAFGPYIVLIAAMIGTGLLGTLVGRRILMKINETFFKRVLNAILILLALRLIWAGASTYL
ncbi:MAG: sulfite exporter TauE/SafE family protein [Pseudomonadota bacterium]